MSLVFSGNNTIITSGVVPLGQGGTGATTQPEAANAILPPQAGKPGHFLQTNGFQVDWVDIGTLSGIPDPTGFENTYLFTDGVTASWEPISAIGIQAAGLPGQLQFNENGTLGATSKISYDSINTLYFGTGQADLFTLQGLAALDNTTGGSSVEIKGGLPFITLDTGTYLPAGDVILTGGPGFGDAQPGNIIFKAGNESKQVLKILPTGALSFGILPDATGEMGHILTSQGIESSPSWQPLPIASSLNTGVVSVGENSGLLITAEGALSSIITGFDATSITITDGIISANLGAAIPDQTGNENKFLTTNGSELLWIDSGAAGMLPAQSGYDGKFLKTDGNAAGWASPFPDQLNNTGKFLYTTGTEIRWENVTIPQAGVGTDGVLGGVKIDGVSIVADENGVITAPAAFYDLPIAGVGTDGVLGGVKIGESLNIHSTTGVLNVGIAGQGVAGKLGGVRAGDGFLVDQDTGIISMVAATTNTLGGVKVDGTSIIITTDGVLSVTGGGGANGYTLPTASNEIKGGIKVGNNLSIDPVTEVLSAVFPQATDLTLGGIKVGSGLAMDSSTGKLSVDINYATTATPGLVKVDGTTIVINPTTGVISATGAGIEGGYALPIAGAGEEGNLGGVKVGDGLSIDGNTGVVSLVTASDTVLGGVKVDGTTITISDGVITATATGSGAALPDQTNNANRFLKTDGSTVSWSDVTIPLASSTVIGGVKFDDDTIKLDADTSAIYVNPSKILPDQTGNGSYYLSTNGVTASWEPIVGSVATTSEVGSVSPDGKTITISPTGTITAKTLSTDSSNHRYMWTVDSQGYAVTTDVMQLNLDETKTQLRLDGVDNRDFNIAAASNLYITTTDQVSSKLNVVIKPGKNSNPGANGSSGDLYLESGDSDTDDAGNVIISGGRGVFSDITDNGSIIFNTNNSKRLTIRNDGAWAFGVDYLQTGGVGQPLVSNGNGASPNWGAVAVEYGGTGATTKQGAQQSLLPDQEYMQGRYLATDGLGNLYWGEVSIDVDPSTTGLTVSGGPIKSTGSFVLGGTLALEHGGTGATTKAGAANAILPDQTGNDNSVLITNGSNVLWSPITASGPLPVASTTTLGGIKVDGTSVVIDANGVITATGAGFGTVTSVAASGGVTGLTFNGSPITGEGTLTLGGVLEVASGGTGATTKVGAQNNILPSQFTELNGFILSTNGTNVQWTDTAPKAVNAINAQIATTAVTAQTITNVLLIEKGGTGAITREAAINNLLPSQSGKVGLFLTTNGENVGWQEFTSIPTSGVNGGVQFNNNGSLSSATKLIYDSTNNKLTVGSYGNTFTFEGAIGGMIDGLPRQPASVAIRAGTQPASNSSSSDVFIQGGDTVGLNVNGGNVYLDGGKSLLSTGGSVIIRTTDGPNTEYVNRLQIKDNGVWLVNGSAGLEGQALISQGPGAPLTWGAFPADAAFLIGDTLAPNVIYSSLTTLGNLQNLNVIGDVGIGTLTPNAKLSVSAGDASVGIEFNPISPATGKSSITAITRDTDLPKPLEINGESITFRTSNEGAGNLTAWLELRGNGALALNGDPGTPGQFLTSYGPDAPASWKTLSIEELFGSSVIPIQYGGTGANTAITASNAIANFGQLRQHNAVTSFNLVQQWGHTFVKGDTGGPGTGTEYYQSTYSLGSDYNWGSGGVYAMQTAIPRNSIKPYMSIRYKEGGGDSSNWSDWVKLSAGYADVAGTIDGILGYANGGTSASTRQGAMNNLAGFAANKNNTVLRNDGTNIVLDKLDLSTDVKNVLTFANGGTGQTTRQNALNALSGTLTPNRVLRSDGTNVRLDTVDMSTDVNGVLAIANGGTGKSSRQAALDNLLPTQGSTTSGKVLKSNGTTHSWETSVTSVAVSGGTTGLTTTGGPITSSGTITLGGSLKVAHGGTGRTSFTEGNYLVGAGANGITTVSSIPATDISGTIAVARGGTGASTPAAARKALLNSYTGNKDKFLRVNSSESDVYWSAIAVDATNLTGTVAINRGGTGATSESGARENLLAITGSASNAGKVLTLNSTGTDTTWATPKTVPGGNNTEVQYNNNGAMAGSSSFTFNRSTSIVNFTNHPTIGTDALQIGYRNLPRVTAFDTNAVGKRVVRDSGFTVPANTFKPGDAISFYNTTSSALVITQGTGLTLRKDGTTSTGNFILAAYGTAFLWFNTATEAVLSGSIT